MGKHTIEVTDETFQEKVLDAEELVVVDFWAGWCGPCRAIAPMLEDAAEELGSSVTIAKVDITSNRINSTRLSVRTIPCLIAFRGGQEVSRHIGSLNKDALMTFIEECETSDVGTTIDLDDDDADSNEEEE